MSDILVPVDGSEPSLKAVRLAASRGGTVHILNVQAPLNASVSDFVGSRPVEEFHRDEGEKCLAEARKLLEASGRPYKAALLIGSPADSILQYCREKGCAEIVMGSRGAGGITGALLGSVAQKVVHEAEVPVTIVR